MLRVDISGWCILTMLTPSVIFFLADLCTTVVGDSHSSLIKFISKLTLILLKGVASAEVISEGSTL